jgi:hypothetical protein
MRKIWKGLAIVALASLGLGVSAFSAHARPLGHWPTTTTATTATTTTTTTAATTTTTVATTTTATPSVHIISPLNNTPYTQGSTAYGVTDVQSSTGGVTCTYSWGDGAVSSPSTAFEISPGVYRCYANHVYYDTTSGWHTVSVVATGADGTVIGTDSVQVYVF